MKERLTLLLKNDKKKAYEYFFIICVLSYALFTVLDLLIVGKSALQWSLLWDGEDFIADFTNVIGYSAERDPYNHTLVYGLGEKAYPPLQYVVTYFLSRSIFNKQHYYDIRNYTSMHADTKIAMMYILLTVITVILLYECIRTYKNGSNFVKAFTSIAIVLSFPIIFSLERGNSILAVLVFVLFYICFYKANNKVLRELSFVSLALAAALKLTPALLGVLLLLEKRWKEAIRTIIYGILFFFLPFLFFKGGFNNIPLFLRNLSIQLETYKNEAGCTIKGYILHYASGLSTINMDLLSTVCTIVTVIICAFLLVATFLSDRNCERLLYLCLTTIILPSHSGTYCIVYLIPATIAFLNEPNKKQLDILVIIGSCFCLCELGGVIGFSLINFHNGLLIILLYSIMQAVTTIFTHFKYKNTISKESPVS